MGQAECAQSSIGCTGNHIPGAKKMVFDTCFATDYLPPSYLVCYIYSRYFSSSLFGVYQVRYNGLEFGQRLPWSLNVVVVPACCAPGFRRNNEFRLEGVNISKSVMLCWSDEVAAPLDPSGSPRVSSRSRPLPLDSIPIDRPPLPSAFAII